VFGCFDRLEISETFVLQSLAEIKAALMETGIRKVFTLGQKFLSGLASDLPGELPDQGALLAVPVVGAVRGQLLDLQTSFDDLRSAYYDLDEDIVFNRIALAISDPTRILTARASKVVLMSKASVVNKYSQWAKDYQATRDHLLSDISCPPPDQEDVLSPEEVAHPNDQTRW